MLKNSGYMIDSCLVSQEFSTLYFGENDFKSKFLKGYNEFASKSLETFLNQFF